MPIQLADECKPCVRGPSSKPDEGPGIYGLSVGEIMDYLLEAIEKSNGLELVDDSTINELSGSLDEELSNRRAALHRKIILHP